MADFMAIIVSYPDIFSSVSDADDGEGELLSGEIETLFECDDFESALKNGREEISFFKGKKFKIIISKMINDKEGELVEWVDFFVETIIPESN
jgi:hypothetical protein